MIRNLRCTVTIDSVLANSKTQNAFLFTVNAFFLHDYPLAVEAGSTPRPLVQKKLGKILYLLICSFLPCLSWLVRSRFRKSRRDLWITLYTPAINLSCLLYSRVLTNVRLQRKVILKTTCSPTFYCTESAYDWASRLSGWQRITYTKNETLCVTPCWFRRLSFSKILSTKIFILFLFQKLLFNFALKKYQLLYNLVYESERLFAI